jgi:gas vesicle protein
MNCFSKDKRPVEVAIALNLTEPKVSKMYRDYLKLRRLDKLSIIHRETNGKLGPFLKLYRQLINEKGMSIEQVVNVVDIAANKLPYMESLYSQAKDEVDNMQRTRQYLSNDIQALKNKISILDATAFSIEQECRRREQQLQVLIAQKNRLEKLIVNILSENNEGYSTLKQIVKENVKAILSENKQIISVSFAALIQTLKADPEMINVISKIPSANDGQQHNGNNNIIKYLELNKVRILNLIEKNYEKLVEALTNNAIDNIANASSFNSTLSLPSSSIFLNPFNRCDTHRIEESDIDDNSKGEE